MTQLQIRTAPRNSCAVCGSKGTPLYHDLMDVLFQVPGKWHLSRCNNQDCGLCWLNPAPLEADIPLLYKNYYTHAPTGGRRSLGRGIQFLFYHCYLITTYLPALVLGLPGARREIWQMFLNDIPPGRLLDVGCGDGNFMHRMHRRGWSVTGLDVDAKAIEHARLRYNFEFLHSDLAGAHFAENSFDAVTMSHVIEHVPDPVALLTETMRILKPGGVLAATTPNAASLGHNKFQDCWRGLEPPRHFQIFTLGALRACAQQASLEIYRAVSSAANADAITVGSLRICQAKNRADFFETTAGVNIIRSLRSLFFQYHEAYRMHKNPECGEEAVLICRKQSMAAQNPHRVFNGRKLA